MQTPTNNKPRRLGPAVKKGSKITIIFPEDAATKYRRELLAERRERKKDQEHFDKLRRKFIVFIGRLKSELELQKMLKNKYEDKYIRVLEAHNETLEQLQDTQIQLVVSQTSEIKNLLEIRELWDRVKRLEQENDERLKRMAQAINGREDIIKVLQKELLKYRR
jgi:hypothetical protein